MAVDREWSQSNPCMHSLSMNGASFPHSGGRPSINCSLEEAAAIHARATRVQAERNCARMVPCLRRALTSTVSFLVTGELVHACNVLPFLRNEVSVLDLPHFGAEYGEFVASILQDLEIVKRLTRITFEPSPTAMQYGHSRAYLYKSWPIPCSLPRCSWDRLTRLHLHVTWWSSVIDAAMDSPMAVLESLEITLPVLDAVTLNYARCFPVLHSLKVHRAYPDNTNLYLYPWNDLSLLPSTLTLLDAGWAQVTSLPLGLLAARIGELTQHSERFQFPCSLTSLTITDAYSEAWLQGYARLSSDHVRVTLEDIRWSRRMTDTNFFPANVERIVGRSSDLIDIHAPSDGTFIAQPLALFTSLRPTRMQFVNLEECTAALGSPVSNPGRGSVRIRAPPIGPALHSVAIAIWAKRLHGVVSIQLVGSWDDDVLTQTLANLPDTVARVDMYRGRCLTCTGAVTMFEHLAPSVTILSLGVYPGGKLSTLVQMLPQTVRHLQLPYRRGLEVDAEGNSRTAPLTVWMNHIPVYMYDGYGGVQRVVTQ